MPACRAAPSTAVVGLLAVAVLAACCLAAGAQAGPEGVPPPPDAQAGGATQPSAAVRPTTTVAFHERPPDADVYRLTLYWPPTVLDAEQQAVARFSVDKGWASPGAWALALQPSRCEGGAAGARDDGHRGQRRMGPAPNTTPPPLPPGRYS